MTVLRLLSTILGLLLVCPAPLWAGDFANREILGFSADGGRFGFEEYGVQDGSGFPYSTIYIIDTNTDQWVNGSPFRARLDDENASLDAARAQSRNMAGSALSSLTEAGIINATNQPLEIVDNPHRMEARPFVFNPPTSSRIEFRLEEIDFYDDEYCKDLGGSKGFRLMQMFKEEGMATQLLHEDTSVPQSRGCPLSYRFADIITYRPSGTNQLVIAIVILFENIGFEGPDGRYLAVTTSMPID